MTEDNPIFRFEPNPNQSSTRLRINTHFNSSKKLTNVPLNWRNCIPWTKTTRVTLKGKKGYLVSSMKIKSDQKLEPRNKRIGM
jgi:hypothetical protein